MLGTLDDEITTHHWNWYFLSLSTKHYQGWTLVTPQLYAMTIFPTHPHLRSIGGLVYSMYTIACFAFFPAQSNILSRLVGMLDTYDWLFLLGFFSTSIWYLKCCFQHIPWWPWWRPQTQTCWWSYKAIRRWVHCGCVQQQYSDCEVPTTTNNHPTSKVN